MSVLNKKPFIQTLINSLSASEKKSLLDCINGETTQVSYSLVLRNLSVSTPIERIKLETKTQVYNGYKIYKGGKITFLMYNIGQDLNMYQVSYPYYERELKGRIKEALDINELRRYLEETGSEVDSGEIDSGDATAGQVLTADGEGGARWENIDLDIISKIEAEYDEDNDITIFTFPKGIMPLSITLNTHDLYLKNGSIVGVDGEEVSGYELDDYSPYDDNRFCMQFVGDLSEQVINSLTYILFDFSSGNLALIGNTYNLFYPQSGTKLYKHYITFNDIEPLDENMTLISTKVQPYTTMAQIKEGILSGEILSAIWISNDQVGNGGQFSSQPSGEVYFLHDPSDDISSTFNGLTIDIDTITPL